MSVIAKLAVEVGLDSGPLDKGLKDTRSNVEKESKDWAKSFGDVGRKFTLGVTAPIVGGLGVMISMGSDLQESISSTSTVYGAASADIIKASENSAFAVGLSQQEYLSAATTLGVFATSAGLTGDAMSNFGQDMIGAAADMASFYNVPVPEALDAIKSGLMGEAEPLRKFGILISDAAINQYAWTHGIAETGQELTDQQKVASRYGYIMEGMGAASGDFARTSGGVANQLRILKARAKDVAAQFGKYLLPLTLKLAKGAQSFIGWIQGLSDSHKKWALGIAAVAAAIGPVLIALSYMLPAIGLLLGPIGLVIAGMAVLGVAFAKNLFGIRDAASAATSMVKKLISPIVEFGVAMKDAFTSGKPISDLISGLPTPLRGVSRGFLLISDGIGDLVKRWQSGGFGAMLDLLPGKLKQIWGGLKSLSRVVLDVAIDGTIALAGKLLEVSTDFGSWITSSLTSLWDKYVTVDSLVDGSLALGGYVASVSKDFGGWLWPQLKGSWNNHVGTGKVVVDVGPFDIKFGVPGPVARIISFINNMDTGGVGEALGKNIAQGNFGAIADGLYDAGVSMMQALGKGIRKIGPKVLLAPLLLNFPALVIVAAYTFIGLALKKGGEFMAGLLKGLTQGFRESVTPFIKSIPGLVKGAFPEVSGWLAQKGADFIQGMKKGMSDRWDIVKLWVAGIPGRVTSAIAGASTALYQKGVDLMTGLLKGLKTVWSLGSGQTVVGWLGGLGPSAQAAIELAAGNFYNAGFNMAYKMWDGLKGVWTNSIVPWLQGLNPLSYIPNLPGLPGLPDIPDIPHPSLSLRNPQASGMVAASGPYAAASGNNLTWTGDIIVQGYNRDPRELTNEIANTLSREFSLAGGFS